MKERNDDDEDEPFLSRQRFEETWDVLKKTKRDKYKFIFNAGDALKEALFSLFSVVWGKEECPSLWEETKIIKLFKEVGSVNDLDIYRKK